MNDREHTIRIAVRKFGPFEKALQKMWETWRKETGNRLSLEVASMDLNDLHRTVLQEEGLKKGEWDIAHLCTDWVAEAGCSGALEDLSPYLNDRPPEDYPRGWSPSLLGLQRYDGKILGLPFHDGPECLVYRADLFGDPLEQKAYREQSGEELRPPETWDDYLRVARFFHRRSKGLYGAVAAAYPDGHNAVFDFCLQLWSRGGELLDEGGRVRIDSPAAVEGLGFYRNYLKDASAIHPSSADFDSVKCGECFASGAAAMMINWFGFAALSHLEGAPQVRGKVGVAPVPRGTPGRLVSLNVYWLYTVGSGSPNKQAAYDFIRFAVSRENDRLLTREGGIGCRISTWQDEEVNRQVPYYHRLEELHRCARTLPQLRNWPEIARIIDQAVQEALSSTAPAGEILREGQLKIDQLVGTGQPENR